MLVSITVFAQFHEFFSEPLLVRSSEQDQNTGKLGARVALPACMVSTIGSYSTFLWVLASLAAMQATQNTDRAAHKSPI